VEKGKRSKIRGKAIFIGFEYGINGYHILEILELDLR